MDARLDLLEGRVEEQSRNWDRLFAELGRVDHRFGLSGIMTALITGVLAAVLTRS